MYHNPNILLEVFIVLVMHTWSKVREGQTTCAGFGFFLSPSVAGQRLLFILCSNPPGSGSCHVAAGLDLSEWVTGIDKHQISPSPPLLPAENRSQRRHDSCIKDKWRWIVHQPCVITTEHKQKPDAFVWCWVWPLSRCLVNRWQTDTWGWKCSRCTLYQMLSTCYGEVFGVHWRGRLLIFMQTWRGSSHMLKLLGNNFIGILTVTLRFYLSPLCRYIIC